MTNWMPRLDGLRGPRYLAIADALARDVRAGRLRPGDRLPPQRLLADLLGLHLSTVTRAYREAARRGLISGMTRRGTVVLDMPHAAALFAPRPDGTGRIDLRTNVPAAFPADAAFDRLFAGLLADQGLPALMRYRTGEEWRTLTADAAGWLTRGGLSLAHHTLVLCAGGAACAGSGARLVRIRPRDRGRGLDLARDEDGGRGARPVLDAAGARP